MTPPFTLYYLPNCPFCLKVLRAADALGVDLLLVDVSQDQEARSLLIQKNGRATVPVLSIGSGNDFDLLPESDDIVAFLHAWAAQFAKAVA